MKIIIRIAANALAVWLTFTLIDDLNWDGEWTTLLVIALLIGVVNAFIKPIVKLLALPIRAVTLGLFTLVINVLLMAGVVLVADTFDLGVTSVDWKSTLIGGLVLSVISGVLSMVLDD